MSKILISSESRYPVKRKTIKQVVDRFLAEQKIKSEVEVSIAVVGDRKMAKLNKQYRDKDGTTPVLTFSQTENVNYAQKGRPFVANFMNPPDSIMRLGDIVISYPQTVLAAAAEDKMVDQILSEFVQHGLRNLLGLN